MRLLDTFKHSFAAERSSKAIYGIILITVVLVGFQIHETKAGTIAIKTLIAALVIVIAEIYSEILGESIKHHKALTREERREIVYDALAILSVALYPTLIFFGSALGIYEVPTAFTAALWLSIIALAIFGYVAIKSSGATKKQAIIKGVALALIGLFIIIAKYATSH